MNFLGKTLFWAVCIGLFLGSSVGASFPDSLEAGKGYWIVEKEIDPLMDTVNLSFTLFCRETIEGKKQGYFDQPKTFTLRLLDGEIDLFITWDDALGGNYEILYRFDDGDVIESQWEQGSLKEEVFFPVHREDLKGFVEKLLTTKEFIVGVTPMGKRRQNAIFDVKGLAYALLPYLDELNWIDLEDTALEVKVPLNFYLYSNDLESPHRLLSDPYIQDTLKELLADDYNLFMESMHSITIPMRYDGTTITIHGGVPGLYTIMEAKLQVHESGAIHVAFLDNSRIIYHTTDMEKFMKSEVLNLFRWANRFPTYPLIFPNAIPPGSFASLAGQYEHRDLQGSFKIEVSGDVIKYEGRASWGARVGFIEGVSTLIDGKAPYVIYSYGGSNEAIMQITFINGKLFVLERTGTFGGLNVTFNGWYEKVD